MTPRTREVEQRSMADSNGPVRAFYGEQSLFEPNVYVSLTYDALDASQAMARVKSPKAGAVVLFAGTYNPLSVCDLD